MSSLEKCLFKSFAHFLIGFFVFLEWSLVYFLYISYIYFGDQTLVWSIGKYVFLYGWLSFHFNAIFFSCVEPFYFDEVPFFYSFFYVPCSGVKIFPCYRWKYCCIECLRFSCLCFPLGLLWCHDLYLNLLFTLNLFLCMV